MPNIEFVDKLFRLDNNDVDVVFKYDIDVEWEFSIPKILVDVACRFDIFKAE